MIERWMLPASCSLVVTLLLVCSGCAGSSRIPSDSSSTQNLPDLQSADEVFNVSNSSKDYGNRYSSVVLVAIAGIPECSGVLIHPRLVLTAGHCVCRGHEIQDTITFDSSTCEKTATAIAVTYESSSGRPDFKRYTGLVRAHHDFRAVLKKKRLPVPPDSGIHDLTTDAGIHYAIVNTVQESKADLALIVLNEAIERPFLPASLARTHISNNDPIVVVGYGADAVENGIVTFNDEQPTRRFGKNFITQPGDEKFTIELPGSLALPGDSGGPCFREQTNGISLVGINSRSAPGKRATFTSTYYYLNWLDAEIKRTEKM